MFFKARERRAAEIYRRSVIWKIKKDRLFSQAFFGSTGEPALQGQVKPGNPGAKGSVTFQGRRELGSLKLWPGVPSQVMPNSICS